MAQFKTRARALDMLGRQQIAGIPTAISELFKNAHDAYADRVEADFYRFNNLFVLRDDGVGMTQEDFERRWLTLGTESKVKSQATDGLPPAYPGKCLRPIMGEKGIGRLAIGVIGPQVLVLTRALREGQANDLIAAFLNWKIFEVPGIDLSEIEVPVFAFPAGTVPTRRDVSDMVSLFRENLTRLGSVIDGSRLSDIEADMASFDVDPVAIDQYVPSMSLTGDGFGTHFYILPAYDILAADIDGNRAEDGASPLHKALTGFTNTMTPGHSAPQITASFRDHKTRDAFDDLIAEREFWTPEEFETADHHVAGTFNEFGQFNGTVSVYKQDPVEHIVPWLDARGKPAECGPFNINFAYVQGRSTETTLPPETWNRLIQKLNLIGGLYIYKDGIRVLPYGNHDYDFLQIERNRTKSAGFYFFSYRRMFGVISISQSANPELTEKAGREGFRENKAYRQFRSILQDFFRQIAADFFREGGTYSDAFTATRADLERTALARRRREALVSQKRKALRAQLDEVFKCLDAGKAEEDVTRVIAEVSRDLEAAVRLADPIQAGNVFIETEAKARQRIEGIRGSYRVSKPRGMGLAKDLNRDWEFYVDEYQRLESSVFAPAARKVDEMVGDLARRAKLSIDRRRRIDRALQDLTLQAKKSAQIDKRETEQTVEEVKNRVVSLTRESIVDVDETTRRVLSRFASMDVSNMEEAALVVEREDLENQIKAVADRNKGLLENVREQLKAVNLSPDEEGRLIGATDMTEDLEQRLLALQEAAAADLELTQLGMAIDVINHEFDGTVKSIRSNLRRLKSWADLNDGLERLYIDLRASFDHLDSYLTLFTPLHRRLYRTKIDISGADIGRFLEDLFKERLDRHQITLEQTSGFRKKTVHGYPSTFYPVFVNLVDNALFWLKDRPGPRIVRLGADGDAFLVSDNGPGVPSRNREAVFQNQFSTKPGGRGMGLHIARRTLEEADYRLTLDVTEPGRGATFRMSPSEDDKDSF